MQRWLNNQIVQVAVLYYSKGISQKAISERMGLSKMAISRMLQKAKEMRIVNMNVELPFKLNVELAKKIEAKYKLDKVYAVRTSSVQGIPEQLGRVWAFYMGVMDLNNKVISIGVGNTVGSMVDSLTPIKTKNTHVVQLMGGLEDVTNFNPFTIVQEISKKLNAKGTFLTSHALAENKQLKEAIISSSYIGGGLDKADIAIFGIGAIEKGAILRLNFITEEELKELKEKSAVGNVIDHYFDAKGDFINSKLEDRIVSLSIEQLRKFKRRIALAGGNYKKAAIKGALLSGIVDTLVIDESTAKLI